MRRELELRSAQDVELRNAVDLEGHPGETRSLYEAGRSDLHMGSMCAGTWAPLRREHCEQCEVLVPGGSWNQSLTSSVLGPQRA